MSELLNKYKLQEQLKATEAANQLEREHAVTRTRRENCIELTGILNKIVQSQSEINDRIDGYRTFNTQCPEFDEFKKKINNDSNNNIAIVCRNSEVDFIRTNVNIKKDLVTYTITDST